MDAGGVTRRVGDERILRRRARGTAGGSDDAAAG
jgi:hypothetical protein